MEKLILVLNTGSSSIKFKVYAILNDAPEWQIKGQLDGIGARPRLRAENSRGETLADRSWTSQEMPSVVAGLEMVVSFFREQYNGELPWAVGHRVVHGGAHYSDATLVTAEVAEELNELCSLAPLHQPNNLLPIKIILSRMPGLPQVACFDTAFHRTHPELADRYAVPSSLYDEGVRRYGFHGLSYDYISRKFAEIEPSLARGKVIVAHLGSGASMCAIEAGRSIESTMGFTALDGLPMGTRPGQLDAGVVLWLLQQKGMSADQIQQLLYNDCGLKGLSGLSNDLRVLLDSSAPQAKLAVDYFVYRIAMAAGSLAAAMQGLAAFIFTAGVGENSSLIRQRVMERMTWLGVEPDPSANANGGPKISTVASRVACYVVPTDEELMIARQTLEVLRHRKID